MRLLPPTLLLLPYLTHLTTAATTVQIQTITRTASASTQPTSPSLTNDATFKADVLAATNFYRKQHDTLPVAWNDSSAKVAAAWAGRCVFEHSGGPTGENLAAGFSNASAAIDGWGLERKDYNFAKPGFSAGTGHFTQLIWSNSTSVGCGRAACNGKNGTPGFYVVCEYFPPGNVVGQNGRFFRENVKKQSSGKVGDTVESAGGAAGGDVSVSSAPACIPASKKFVLGLVFALLGIEAGGLLFC